MNIFPHKKATIVFWNAQFEFLSFSLVSVLERDALCKTVLLIAIRMQQERPTGAMVKVSLKWNKSVFTDVEVGPNVADFKATLQKLTASKPTLESRTVPAATNAVASRANIYGGIYASNGVLCTVRCSCALSIAYLTQVYPSPS